MASGTAGWRVERHAQFLISAPAPQLSLCALAPFPSEAGCPLQLQQAAVPQTAISMLLSIQDTACLIWARIGPPDCKTLSQSSPYIHLHLMELAARIWGGRSGASSWRSEGGHHEKGKDAPSPSGDGKAQGSAEQDLVESTPCRRCKSHTGHRNPLLAFLILPCGFG